MKKFVHLKINALRNGSILSYPGMKKFDKIYTAINGVHSFSDRTNTIKFPFESVVLDPIPKLVPMNKDYEEICNERAKELVMKSEERDVNIYVLYSGGIDSTLVIVSLLKNCTQKQRERIIICLSEDSINENPNFYSNFIKNKLKVESSYNFKYLLGSKHLLVTGGHNDQLFGIVLGGDFTSHFGESVIHEPYSKELMVKYFNYKLNDYKLSCFYGELFDKLWKVCPVTVKTNFDYFWWITFALRWDGLHYSMLNFAPPSKIHLINKEYLNENYYSFFRTKDFQLWSMYNLDKKIKGEWSTYKYVCKDIIYAFTKDEDYKINKQKISSFINVIRMNASYNFIDSDFNFLNDIDFKEYYIPDNDFI